MSTPSTDLDTAFQHWTALHAWWCARQTERASVGKPLAPRKHKIVAEASFPERFPRCHVCDCDLGHHIDDVREPICDECYQKAQAELRCGTYDAIGQCELSKGHEGPHLDPRLHHHFGENVSCDCDKCQDDADLFGSDGDTVKQEREFQGADLSHPQYELLWAKIRHEHANLPPDAQRWVNEISLEARQAALSFHTKQVQTERSYHLCKALVTLAAGGGANSDVLAVLLDHTHGVPITMFTPKWTRGRHVGSLDHKQAEKFAALADEWATPPDAA